MYYNSSLLEPVFFLWGLFSANLLPYPLSGGGVVGFSIMTSSSSDSKLIVITSSAGDPWVEWL